MFSQIWRLLRQARDAICGWLDQWIISLGGNAPTGRGLWAHLWTLFDLKRSVGLFFVALGGIAIVLLMGTALLVKAALTMFLVFVSLWVVLMQIKPELRAKIIATVVKYRLIIDSITTVVGVWAVFGALFGVTTSFTWAFTLLGVTAFISILDWYGTGMLGEDYVNRMAWSPFDHAKTEEAEYTLLSA